MKNIPNIIIRTLFLDMIESFDQKYIPKNIINGIPKPKRIYFGIDVFNLFA